MSNNVREYPTKGGNRMLVTATVYGSSNLGMQFTIGEYPNIQWAILTKEQLIDLKEVIEKRLDGRITATGIEEHDTIVNPKGKVIKC